MEIDYQLPPLVFYNNYDHVGFLLDIKRNVLIELSENDTLLLIALLQCSTSAEVIHQVRTHTPSMNIGEAEIRALVERLTSQHLLEPRHCPPLATCTATSETTEQKAPATHVGQATPKQRLAGAGHIIAALGELRKGEEGFYRAYQYLQGLALARRASTTQSEEALVRKEYWFYRLITGLIEHRLAHLLGQEKGNKGLCMIRAIALCAYLLSLSIPAYVVIARPKYGASSGFKLHGWVEIGGKPVNERPNIRQGYMVMHTFPTL